jgi:hypothetical protein
MQALPFPGLPSELLSPSAPAPGPDLSRFTAPTWARSVPARRPHRVGWPPREPALAADGFFADLATRTAVDDRITRRVQGWTDRACLRIVECVRPHLGDVDAVLCGSLANGTHVATAAWEVDIAVRARVVRPGWGRESDSVLADIARWLDLGIGADIVRGPQAVVIEAIGGVPVNVGVCWRPEGPNAEIRGSWSDDGALLDRFIQPAAHRDLIAARDASLGGDSSFLKLIRIVKHLNATWAEVHGKAPLSSFLVEVLALEVCRRPFALAEGVTEFLGRSARLIRDPVSHPLDPRSRLVLARPSEASALLAHAADICEQSLFTTDAATASAQLQRLFG